MPNCCELSHAGGHDVEPGLAQVFGEQADPAVEKRAAEATFLEQVELSIQLGGIEIIVQRIERHRAVRIGGCWKSLCSKRVVVMLSGAAVPDNSEVRLLSCAIALQATRPVRRVVASVRFNIVYDLVSS